MRMPLTLVVIMLLPSCTSTYQAENIKDVSGKLIPNKSVAISKPDNGHYDATEYAQSGEMTAKALKAAFSSYSSDISIVEDCRDLQCLKNRAPRYTYLVVPEILHWEDRATEWSGLPDRITIKLSIYEGKERAEIASVKLQGKSKWATFGGDHPQDLLQQPLDDYVRSLY